MVGDSADVLITPEIREIQAVEKVMNQLYLFIFYP
jgi:hypothetical protein